MPRRDWVVDPEFITITSQSHPAFEDSGNCCCHQALASEELGLGDSKSLIDSGNKVTNLAPEDLEDPINPIYCRQVVPAEDLEGGDGRFQIHSVDQADELLVPEDEDSLKTIVDQANERIAKKSARLANKN